MKALRQKPLGEEPDKQLTQSTHVQDQIVK